MAKLDNLGKFYINGILKLGVDDITYEILVNNNRVKYDDNEVIEYLLEKLNNILSNGTGKENAILKFVTAIDQVLYYSKTIKDKNRFESSKLVSTLKDYIEKYEINNTTINQKIEELSSSITSSVVDSIDSLTPKEIIEEDPEEITSKEITKLQKELDKSKSNVEKWTEKYNNEKENNKQLKREIKDISNEKNHLQKEKDNLNKKINLLQTKQEGLNETITTYEETLNNQSKEIESLKEEKENNKIVIETFNRRDLEEERLKIIQRAVFELIAVNTYSTNELIEKLNEKNITASKEDLRIVLNRIGMYVNVNRSSFDKKYGIEYINDYMSKRLHNINVTERSVDLLFVSDIHIDTNNEYNIERLDALYEYAKKAGIKNIINCGDVFDFDTDINTSNYLYWLEKIKKDLDFFIEKFPYDDDIINSILGGNHDKRVFQYGVDPLKVLTMEREDVNSLGYKSAYLIFNGRDNVGLHHPTGARDVDIKSRAIEELNAAYAEIGFPREKSILDILGHFHKPVYNSKECFYTLPSYQKNNPDMGATHLRINFNSDGRIESINIYQLLYSNNKLRKIGEIEHVNQKQLTNRPF